MTVQRDLNYIFYSNVPNPFQESMMNTRGNYVFHDVVNQT
jgi:hypothetical protein